MLRIQPSVGRQRVASGDVTRRLFLHRATVFVAGASTLGLAACGDGGADLLLPDDDEDPTDAGPVDSDPADGGQSPPADDDPPGDDPADDPLPDGVEVKMSRDLEDVGGTHIVDARAVIAELDTNNNGLGDEPILLIRVDEDTVAANTIVCTHQQCNVGYNERNERLDCPCHGSRYNLNGRVIRGPAPRALKHFTAVVQGDSVFLENA